VIVVDTDVTSELMRAAPSPVVTAWVRSRRATELYTTPITVAEIRCGIERLPEGRRKGLLRTAATEVFSAFSAHILPYDTPAAVTYAGIVSERERVGAPIDGFDAQIASICRTNGATLATRNTKDFAGTGVSIVTRGTTPRNAAAAPPWYRSRASDVTHRLLGTFWATPESSTS